MKTTSNIKRNRRHARKNNGVMLLMTLVLVSVLVPLVMWLVFYKLLTVNIPMGVLQPLRDLVDKL